MKRIIALIALCLLILSSMPAKAHQSLEHRASSSSHTHQSSGEAVIGNEKTNQSQKTQIYLLATLAIGSLAVYTRRRWIRYRQA